MSSPSAAPSHKQLISLPIFWQVMGLSMAVLVLALVIPVLVVLKAPEPPPSGYSLAEVVTAFKTGEVRLQNGHRLKAVTVSARPAFIDKMPQATDARALRTYNFQAGIAQKLAAELHVPADTVFVHVQPHRRFDGGPRTFAFQRDNPRDNFTGGGPTVMTSQAPPNDFPRPDQAPDVREGPASDMPPADRTFNPSFGGNRVVTFNGETRADIFYPAFSAAWQLKDGTWRVITPPRELIAPWQERLLLGFVLTALLILPLAWWLSQRLSRPIIAFSEAASKLSVEDNAPPVLSVGPREVRAAAEVLNDMQARIRKQVESRTMLMAAIAHDLKTPLARMRLRIEDVPAPLREKLNNDIAHMDGLIRSAMSFTSAHKMNETLRPLDFSALVDSLSDDLCAVCDMDPARIEDNIMVRGDAVALKRILINLVENAGRYAGGCRIELARRGAKAELRVIDNGPGLPPEALETVFEPFYRLESSRNRDTGGTGLGLSVARALTEAQGGTLTAVNRYEGTDIAGLELLMVLPILAR
ncbi:HAMP domain-containing sensor histidine kinase [Asticcacaulis sp.]|uniref:HAMP domain-containing sensor histidine kinase n=1 Tax=Asticcacaulis sp. TaxID=1872648 RepID=UPI003F7B74BF